MKLYSKEYAGSRNIMNPQREYIPAAKTNIAETFKRIQAEMQRQPAKRVRRVK